MKIRAVLLMAAMMGCSDDTSTADDTGSDASASTCDFTISLIDYKLVPADITAQAGTIVLCAKNDGKAPHDLAVRDDSDKVLGRTMVLGPDEQDQFSLELSAGAFDIFCTQGGHESLGMKGTLTVE
jgi:plastocyanin